MRLLYLSVSCVAFAFLAVSSAAGQSIRPTLPPGFVDGAKLPDSVPDSAAFRLIFMRLSALGSDPKLVKQRDAVIGQIGLTTDDRAKLGAVVATFGQQYSNWRAKVAASRLVSAQDDADAKALALLARDTAVQTLTPSGVSKFVQFVQREKAHMIVRP